MLALSIALTPLVNANSYCDASLEMQKIEFFWDKDKQDGFIYASSTYECDKRECKPVKYALSQQTLIANKSVYNETTIGQLEVPSIAYGNICIEANKVRSIILQDLEG